MVWRTNVVFWRVMRWLQAVQFAWQTACGTQPPGGCSNQAIERMWQRWQGRREHPIYSFDGHPLLSEWSVRAFYLSAPF